MRLATWPFLAVSILCAAPAIAAPPAPPAAPIPIEDFVREPDYLDVKVSPDGQHVATTRVFKGRHVLEVLRVKDGEVVGTFGVPGDRDIEDFYWPSNKAILFGLANRLGKIGKPELTGDLMAVNIDGTESRRLIAAVHSNGLWTETDHRTFELVDLLRKDDDNILVATYEHNASPYLQRLNINTGVRSTVLQAEVRYADFITDEEGEVRFQVGTEKDGTNVVLERKPGDILFKEIQRFADNAPYLSPSGMPPGPDTAYFWGNLEAPTTGLYKVTAGKRPELLYRDSVYDVAGVIRGRDRSTPLGVAIDGARYEWKFFDEKNPEAIDYQNLRRSFGNRDVWFNVFNDERTLAVLVAASDVEPATYYLIDLQKKKMVMRLPTRPWIDPARMSPRKHVEYKARDGLNLHAIVTVPRGQQGPMPAIVLPHGGPYGVRESWRFETEAQLLASRGYVVIQPDFRGSGGYGREFQKAGYREWAGKMQNDVTDAARWAVAQGYADPARICIYGASYGAYAALVAVEQEPALYRCAAGYAGVYDLTLMRSKGDIAYRYEGQAYLKEALGNDPADLRQRSPSSHAAKIKVPVFLAHGEDDLRAPFDHFKVMRAALEAAGNPPEILVKDNEGHGFYAVENQVEFYTKLLAFFDKNTAPPARKP